MVSPPTAKDPLPQGLRCKTCVSASLYRHGFTTTGVRRYKCRDCGLTFVGADALPGMRIPVVIVGAAVSMFYEGMSLNVVRRQLNRVYEFRPSDSTVYDWVLRFTKTSLVLAEDLTPMSGDTWIVDETSIKIGGRQTWVWDIFDDPSRFLLASRLSNTRRADVVRSWATETMKWAGQAPKRMVAEQLASSLCGIEPTLYPESTKAENGVVEVVDSTEAENDYVDRAQGRAKVMRGMSNMAAAELVLGGWRVHYNFLRPHEALDGETPGSVAGLDPPFKTWADIVRRDAVGRSARE